MAKRNSTAEHQRDRLPLWLVCLTLRRLDNLKARAEQGEEFARAYLAKVKKAAPSQPLRERLAEQKQIRRLVEEMFRDGTADRFIAYEGLSKLPLAEYKRERKNAAKRLGVSVSTLDWEVHETRLAARWTA